MTELYCKDFNWLLASIRGSCFDQPSFESLPKTLKNLPFVHLWESVYRNAWQYVCAHPGFPNVSSLIDESFDKSPLVCDLISDLVRACQTTLYKEFKDFRDQYQYPEQFPTPSPATRDDAGIYFDFLRWIRSDSLIFYFEKYPSVVSRVSSAVSNWRSSIIEFLLRYKADRGEIVDYFGLDHDIALRSFSPGLGDKHNHGRSASLICLGDKCSTSFKLIYKPTPLDMLVRFSTFLQYLSQENAPFLLCGLKGFSREGYGYVEHIEYQSCSDPVEVDGFYSNLGALAAVLYLLRANDCHYENIIANKNLPILVDCETLFQPRSEIANSDPSDLFINDGIQRTGLIGALLWNEHSDEVIEIGAAGLKRQAFQKISQLSWIHLNSDKMQLVVGSASIESLECLPSQKIESDFQLLKRYLCLSRSFREMSDFLCSLNNAGGLSRMLRACFEGSTARVLVRNTSIYGDVLNRLVSVDAACPEYQMNSTCQNHLSTFVVDSPYLRSTSVILSEAEQLCFGDVPIFFCDTNSCCLKDASGNVLVNDCFSDSALDLILNHLPLLSSDFDDQCKLLDKHLRVSLAPQSRKSNVSFSPIKDLSISHELGLGRHAFGFEVASVVADCLLSELLVLSSGLLWSKLEIDPGQKIASLDPISSSLYDGYLGILIFLDELASHSSYLHQSENRTQMLDKVFDYFLDPLLAATIQLPHDLYQEWIDKASLGLDGIGGSLIAFKMLSQSSYIDSSRKKLIHKAIFSILGALQVSRINSPSFDILHGKSGLISALLYIGGAKALSLALRLGYSLCSTQLVSGGWSCSSRGAEQISFSHGSCGAAASLAALHFRVRNERFHGAALSAYKHQNSFFDNQNMIWPDLRVFSKKVIGYSDVGQPRGVISSAAWCSGATGSLMSRLVALKFGLTWQGIDREIDSAVNAIVADDPAKRFHLCCGLSGSAAVVDILIHDFAFANALRRADKESIRDFYNQAVASMFDNFMLRQEKIALSSISGVDDIAPGLFDGLSGIGMMFLSIANPSASAKLSSLLSAGLL